MLFLLRERKERDLKSESCVKHKMEEKSDSGLKASLLGSGGRSRRLSRKNSYNTLINDFVSRLPPKLRAGVDPESPDNIDYSRVSGLSQGWSVQR